MVSIYQGGGKRRASGKRKGPAQASSVTVTLEKWDPRGRGVCRTYQPVLFVDGALPGETCQVAITRSKKQVCEGHVTKVLEPAPARQTPFCPVYEQCGGCQLQHVERDAALAWRQQALDEQIRLTHSLDKLPWVTPLRSAGDQYRRKTRLAIDARKGKPLALGFRAAKSDKVVNVSHCPVLEPELNDLLAPLHRLLEQLSGRTAIGHVSLLRAHNGIGITFRCTQPFADSDRELLMTFAQTNKVLLRLDYGDHSEALHKPVDQLLCATTDELSLAVTTEDFIQVNAEVNLAMIEQALGWLAPQAQHKVLDLFCGLGNFSLPLAKRCAGVTAVEGVSTMVQKGEKVARQQGIININWRTADLNNDAELSALAMKKYDKVLLDPSREGAFETCQHIAKARVESVVYVSCNPATFNRDLAPLLQAGYRIVKLGLMEMFPYTQHIESMALLERVAKG
ncbi:MAG: 23S rRNA (uracil(1939)-C(5))-methyltransferase RlmD [Pseudomonadota bacterium]|nr:23S rRNA (uracil(1939)-C(5))-methyltransferase RlmD [Pseudomonadota bacterium]